MEIARLMSHDTSKEYNEQELLQERKKYFADYELKDGEHINENFELVCKLSKALINELAKTNKLKIENSFLKTTCEQQKHLLYVTTCSHEELKLIHEELCVTHDNLIKDHAFLH